MPPFLKTKNSSTIRMNTGSSILMNVLVSVIFKLKKLAGLNIFLMIVMACTNVADLKNIKVKEKILKVINAPNIFLKVDFLKELALMPK